jgi:hypothetical protein
MGLQGTIEGNLAEWGRRPWHGELQEARKVGVARFSERSGEVRSDGVPLGLRDGECGFSEPWRARPKGGNQVSSGGGHTKSEAG